MKFVSGPGLNVGANDLDPGPVDTIGLPIYLCGTSVNLHPEEVPRRRARVSWHESGAGTWRPHDLGGRLIRITPNLRAEGINIEVGKIDRNRRYVNIYSQRSENLVSVVSLVSPSLVKN